MKDGETRSPSELDVHDDDDVFDDSNHFDGQDDDCDDASYYDDDDRFFIMLIMIMIILMPMMMLRTVLKIMPMMVMNMIMTKLIVCISLRGGEVRWFHHRLLRARSGKVSRSLIQVLIHLCPDQL